jgi:hypothetical protein
MKTKIRQAVVCKKITLVDSHNAVYSQHIITGTSNKMIFGHHPTVWFTDKPLSGVISTSRIKYGMVSPQQAENPENRGYSCLQPGMKFERLNWMQEELLLQVLKQLKLNHKGKLPPLNSYKWELLHWVITAT